MKRLITGTLRKDGNNKVKLYKTEKESIVKSFMIIIIVITVYFIPSALEAQLNHQWQSPKYSFSFDNSQVVDLNNDGQLELLVRNRHSIVAIDLQTKTEKWSYNVGDLFSLEDWIHDYNNDGNLDIAIQISFGKPLLIDLVNGAVLLDPGFFTDIEDPEFELISNIGNGKLLLKGETDTTFTYHLIDLDMKQIERSYSFAKDTTLSFYPIIEFRAIGDFNNDLIGDFAVNVDPYGAPEYVFVTSGADNDTLLNLSHPDTSYKAIENYNDGTGNNIVILKEFEILDFIMDIYSEISSTPTSVSDQSQSIPINYSLSQNYPNPFNLETKIEFTLPVTSNVILKIYNSMGQQVRILIARQMSAGHHTLKWNGVNDSGILVSSGMYMYQIQTDNFLMTKKMLLVK